MGGTAGDAVGAEAGTRIGTEEEVRGMLSKRLLEMATVALAGMLAVAGCGGGSGDGKQKLVLALDWFPNADHAGIYAAQAQGYFAEEGLKVELQSPGNPEDPPKFVAADKVDLAISYEPDVIQAKAAGLPITAVGSLVSVPLNSVLTLKTSGITSPAGLKGKKVAHPGIPSNEVYLQTMLKQAGVDRASVELVDVGFDLGPALRGGKVDAIIGGYWNVEAVEAELQGYPVNVLKLEAYGVPVYDELVFIASEKGVREKAEKIRKFLRAVAKGHAYAVANPEGAIDAVAKANPEMGRELIARGVRLLVPIWSASKPFGRMDEARWQAFVDFLHTNKLIERKPAMDTLLTNRLLG
ncbi:MAG: hypothetical protein EXR49_08480 [Dehalococcoidia bacterium]|nr:hypothetical protein [Dehalococcoidia bacterium]